MVFYLLDQELNAIRAIDSYKSYIWTSRYYAPGDFEMCLPASTDLLNIIKIGYFIIREDDYTRAMIVYSIEITTDIEEGNQIIIRGYCAKSLLDKRIVWNQTILKSKVEYALRKLVTENAISPTDTDRVIPYLQLGESKGFTETISAQYTGTNLGEAITEICKTKGFGYDILLDLEEKTLSFIVYKGTDRSYNQNENPWVIFSEDYENLLSSDYSYDTTAFKNVVKIAGEGEGKARKTASIGTASGFNRVETFVDARDISSNEGEISDTEYEQLLIERGNEKIAEFVTEEKMEGEIERNYNFILNKDYFLGDTVEVINEYGIAMTPTITEITESDDGQQNVVIKFES